jgi:RNA polymerase sigma-70 factor (ECF subfamily)
MRADPRRLFQLGRSEWPDLELSFEVFLSHCERLALPNTELSELHAADLYLCCACAHGDRSALGTLEKSVVVVVRKAIARIHADPDFVQEIYQEVWAKLLGSPKPGICEYAARGPLGAWLRVSATRLALDHARRRQIHARRSEPLDEAFASDSIGVETELLRQRYAIPFRAALRHAVESLSARERNVLRMHLQGGCSIDEIGRAYKCHRATAARWLERARGRVFELLHAELARHDAGLTPSEVRSIAASLGSVLIVTVFATEAAVQDDRPCAE